MEVSFFVHSLTGRVFKMIPLKESEMNGSNVYLREYTESLFVEMSGGAIKYDTLASDSDYSRVVSIIGYLSKNESEFKVFRREVLKVLRLLNTIERKTGVPLND